MTETVMIEQFIEDLKEKKNLSKNTMDAYRQDLRHFHEFLQERNMGDLQDATNTSVVAYMLAMKNEGKSKSTVNRRLASLRSFYRWLLDKGMIKENPAASIRSPRIEHKQIQYLSIAEVEKLLEMPDDSVKGKRDRAILEVLYATGIRVSEAVELKVSDVDLRMGFVACSGQHGRARIVPMGKPAQRALKDYMNSSRKILMKDGDPDDRNGVLFVNYLGKPFSRQGMWKVLRKYGEMAGLQEKLTPQSIRNSFAMHMVQNGIDIKSLQELMGHEDITATQVYFGSTRKRIKDVYDRTHPRAE
ncbi:MAG: tyrosine recombinase [Eubacterium sp.]|jgi:integrase/recombinase XerD|uniref:tyrosine recombinase n=1 Tax=Eubacterium sp. F2 TaxID=3381348 RepID=UPI003907F88C|nr:tyrosine recombinase [Eubacterium sp.]MCI2197104.1 tyrosine recombinase [Eubacterium sp.]